jgi:hypothetical protein
VNVKTLVLYGLEVPLIGITITAAVAAVTLLACAILAIFIALIPVTLLLQVLSVVQLKAGVKPLHSYWL